MKQLYIIRHCKAEGQEPEAALTSNGLEQATSLVRFFEGRPIDRIVSSPYTRAVESIKPLATERALPIELDERLVEKVLTTESMPDWLDRLRDSFTDFDLCFPGGESNRTAMNRAISAVNDLLNSDARSSLIVTHGALLTLLLHHFDNHFGFEEWLGLTNPDVFLITVSDKQTKVMRLWTEDM